MNRKKNIWIVSEFYYPVFASTGYYVTEIAEFLARKINNINVLCTDANYNNNDEFEFIKEESRNDVFIHRVKSVDLDKNNFISRSLKLFSSSIKLFVRLLFLVRRGDEVLVLTNPAFLILLMPLFKILKGANYKILVHDIFPENLVAIGKIRGETIFYKLLRQWYNLSYSKSQLCIVIGRDMRNLLLRKNVKLSNIVLIPNWSDTNEIQALNKCDTEFIKKNKLEDKFIFQFAGNLGNLQGLENIMKAIQIVQNSNIHFLFIGSGAMENSIHDFIKKNRLENMTHIGYQNRNRQNDFLNACDVGIVTLNVGMYGLGVPSKSYNIMAAGKPLLVIADENSEISQLVKEHNIGWVVPPGDPVSLSEIFEKIYHERSDTGTTKICDPREIAVKFFSKDIILNKYYDIFK
jgi:glycosyltransferase involved in cell wall biosynthesis